VSAVLVTIFVAWVLSLSAPTAAFALSTVRLTKITTSVETLTLSLHGTIDLHVENPNDVSGIVHTATADISYRPSGTAAELVFLGIGSLTTPVTIQRRGQASVPLAFRIDRTLGNLVLLNIAADCGLNQLNLRVSIHDARISLIIIFPFTIPTIEFDVSEPCLPSLETNATDVT
jgi:hypothetical protein